MDAGVDVIADGMTEGGAEASMSLDAVVAADASGDGDGGACSLAPGASTSCSNATLCAGRCVSLNESSSHCGPACGATCRGFACVEGSCATWAAMDLAASSYNAYVARGALPVLAWGEAFSGALGDRALAADTPVEVAGTEGAVDVETGYRNACAIVGADRRVRCWGHGMAAVVSAGPAHVRTTPAEVPSLTGAREVSVGENFACAIRADGRVVCWGRRGAGLLGEGPGDAGAGDFVWSPVLVALPPEAIPVAHISSGTGHTCAVSASATDARNVWCWGQDSQSVVGRSVLGAIAAPDRVARTFDSPARTVLARDFTTCITTAIGSVYCWGNNESGVADPTVTDGANVVEPQRINGALRSVAADSLGAFTLSWCALQRCGDVYCWGADRFGEISLRTTVPADGGAIDAAADSGAMRFVQPTRITSDVGPLYPGVASLAVLVRAGCVLRPDGTVECWGDSDRGSRERVRTVSAPSWPR